MDPQPPALVPTIVSLVNLGLDKTGPRPDAFVAVNVSGDPCNGVILSLLNAVTANICESPVLPRVHETLTIPSEPVVTWDCETEPPLFAAKFTFARYHFDY